MSRPSLENWRGLTCESPLLLHCTTSAKTNSLDTSLCILCLASLHSIMVSSKSTRALFLVSTDGRRSVIECDVGLKVAFFEFRVSSVCIYSQRLSTELSFFDMVRDASRPSLRP
jgi:hypothetical protein